MSDLLIRGMEMPMPGRYEAVIIVLDKSTAEIAISPAEDDIGYWKEYPLVPVPPHGDLIDRDTLMETYTADAYDLNKMHMTKESYENLHLKVGNVQAVISKAPTIIPASE